MKGTEQDNSSCTLSPKGDGLVKSKPEHDQSQSGSGLALGVNV